MNEEDQLLSDSEYLFNIQLYNILLERITLRGRWKLCSLEVMDVRLVRSIHQFIHTIVTFHFQ